MLDFDLVCSIISFMEPIDAWPMRLVSREWNAAVERRHWPVVPRKIDAKDKPFKGLFDADEVLIRAAVSAIAHLKHHLGTSGPSYAFTGTASNVSRELSSRYLNYSGGKSIKSNCVAVYRDGFARQFVMNFWFPGWNQQMLTDVLSTPGGQFWPARDVMGKISHMHAEIRVLHEGKDPDSVDKPMCILCAMTFRTVTGGIKPHHGGALQWYTFSTRIFSTRERVTRYFGGEFARLWFSLDNDTRTRLLRYCVQLTNSNVFSSWAKEIDEHDVSLINWDEVLEDMNVEQAPEQGDVVSMDATPTTPLPPPLERALVSVSEGTTPVGPPCPSCGVPQVKLWLRWGDGWTERRWKCPRCAH